MENALLYPFLAICLIIALPFIVWGYFAVKEYRRRKSMTEHERVSEDLFRFLTKPRAAVQSAPMYRHRGHPHAAKRRGKNRADFRRYVFKLLKIAEAQS